MSGPLSQVLAAIEDGATSVDDIARRCTMEPSAVRAGIDHLVRMGRLETSELSSGCPSGGCGTCASAVEGAPGCGSPRPSAARRGPVLVQLRVRR
ncbi:hypothetical protein GCM10027418_21320 [Mariniluteicoccus endophyticus]